MFLGITLNHNVWNKNLWRIMLSASCSIASVLLAHFPSNAQVIPDLTLGRRSSRIVPTQVEGVDSDLIVGGARAGKNLFHSFSRFDIQSGNRVYFQNPQGVGNIISRVSGTVPSNIQGTLGVLGRANLIFLNRNGITFGEGATLDVNNHFIASTADRVLFDRGIFSANNAVQQNLLRTDPIALAFNRNLNAPIEVQARASAGTRQNFDLSRENIRDFERLGLRVNNGKSLLLVGGNVSLDGSGLNAFSGGIEIGSLTRGGQVDLNLKNKTHKLLFPERFIGGTVQLAENSIIDVSGERLGTPAGTVKIVSGDISLSGSEILSEANSDQDGGRLAFRALGNFEMLESSRLSTLTSGTGQGSSIRVDANRFIARDASVLVGASMGAGQGGETLINAKELFQITGANQDTNRTGIISNATAQGNGGDIEVNVSDGNLLITNGANISSGSNTPAAGSSGNIKLKASGAIALTGIPPFGLLESGVNVSTESSGDAGSIEVDARRLRITDGNQIVADTLGSGDGGNIKIRVREDIDVDGFNFNINGFTLSRIQAASSGTGDGGSVDILARDVTVRNSAQIAVASTGNSPEGAVTPGNSAGGNITISADNLTLESASIQAQSARNPSNRSSTATILLNISNNIQLGNPEIADNSFISAAAFNQANGGNILIINTPILSATLPPIPPEPLPPFPVAFGNDIIASSEAGPGGNIIINVQRISRFGDPTNQGSVFLVNNGVNDIDATGAVPGFVDIDTVTELDQGLIELPQVVVDPDSLIAQNPCSRGSDSEYTLSGRGGLPSGVKQPFSDTQSQVDFISPTAISKAEKTQVSLPGIDPSNETQKSANLPAQGWVYDQTGKIQLIAYQNQVTPESTRKPRSPQGCSS